MSDRLMGPSEHGLRARMLADLGLRWWPLLVHAFEIDLDPTRPHRAFQPANDAGEGDAANDPG